MKQLPVTKTALRIYKTILLLFVSFSTGFNAHAQSIERFNSFSYNVNEGLLQSTIGDITFDKNNFCWLSFPNGIQKFDGNNFIDVPVQTGLPDDKFARFFNCVNGDLLISHSQGISKYEIAGNRFVHVYKQLPSLKKPVLFIGEDDSIIYFYTETGNITGVDCRTFKVSTETKTGLPLYSSNSEYPLKVSANIINHKVALNTNYRLYLWDLKERKLLSGSELIPDMSSFFLRLKTENEVLYYNMKTRASLELYSFSTRTSSIVFIKEKNREQVFRSSVHLWQNKTLLSLYNKLYETDTSLQVIKTELVNFQNQPIAAVSSIARIKEDNFGNLYLVTISNGIKKIIRNNYPIKYYGTSKNEGNFIISLLPDKKNNRILAGTAGNGLFIFDTLQRLVRHIKTLPGQGHSLFTNTIIKDNKGNYLLFISGEKNVWLLRPDCSLVKYIPVSTSLPEHKSGVSYFANFLSQNEQGALTQSAGRIYKTSFTGNSISEHEFSNAYILSGLLHKADIITHGNDELIFLDTVTFKIKKRIPFKNTGDVRCFTKDAANNIYIGSNKGIFKIDSTGKILQHLDKENGLPDECIYAMVFDHEGFLWCSSNKGVFRINRDNSILQLTKDDGLQENEFNTNIVAKTEDGEIFFGGVNGLSSFYPAAISGFEEKINLLFTKIKINNEEAFTDTAVWDIEKLSLPYHQNSLSFDFIAMANNNPGQYIYQYKMEGIDKAWIQNTGLQTVRYFLSPGKYVFKIYASRFFDKEAKPMKEIEIIIRPPFWKTWWFIASLALLFTLGMAYIFNQYNRSRYQKKLIELESEHKVQLERERISRDLHDSIGAYANAVLYNTELLEKEKEVRPREELMSDLKFASKDIITSLRETIWALKKDNYSAQDCLLRIRNFVQPFSRYYQHIQFKIEGDAPDNKELHYTKALNAVRIVQEAVTNAIKHATARNIHIASVDKNGRWQLTITDDGKGFDYDTLKETEQGNGLNNMKQRAIDSGFDLSVQSQQGVGTSVIIRI